MIPKSSKGAWLISAAIACIGFTTWTGAAKAQASGDAVATPAQKAKLAALRPVTDALLAKPPASDWLVWRGTHQQLSFSALKQVNKTNVANLREAWNVPLALSQNEVTPQVHDGVMFIQSGLEVKALDATNGDLLWKFTEPAALGANSGPHAPGQAKAMAFYKDKVFVALTDKHLVALNMRTGAEVWNLDVFKGPVDMSLGTAPMVVHGKVIVGTDVGYTTRGGNYIFAVDADTGKEVWRFNVIARPGQPGGDTWNGAPVDQRFGGGVWTGGSYNSKYNLVYYGVGQSFSSLLAYPKKGNNDALYTDSTVALNPDTGKLVWHYQHFNRDVWDQDFAFEQTLATVMVNGKPRDALVTGSKLAIFDVVDRGTGKYLFSRDMGVQTLVKSIDPKTGHKTIDPALEPEPGKFKTYCSGGHGWTTSAVNPTTHILYVPMGEGGCSASAMAVRTPEQLANGGNDLLSRAAAPAPQGAAPQRRGSRLQAVNLDTGKVVWVVHKTAGNASSLLATAGGLLFSGSSDNKLQAYDDKTGDVLWEGKLNGGPKSNPSTYSVGGVQYVAVTTGGGSMRNEEHNNEAAPETWKGFSVPSTAPPMAVVVYKLPDAKAK